MQERGTEGTGTFASEHAVELEGRDAGVAIVDARMTWKASFARSTWARRGMSTETPTRRSLVCLSARPAAWMTAQGDGPTG